MGKKGEVTGRERKGGDSPPPQIFFGQEASLVVSLKAQQKYDSAVTSVTTCQVVDGHASRAVLTNGHTGHVPRAPEFFSF